MTTKTQEPNGTPNPSSNGGDGSLNIHQRIHAVMEDLTYILKDLEVDNKYKAVSHDAVSAKVHPVVVRHRINILPSVTKWGHESKVVEVWDGYQKKVVPKLVSRTTVDIDVAFVNIDNPEDQIVTHWFGFGVDTQDKGPGKAISYATKYAMLKTFVLETGEDESRNIDFENEKEPTFTPEDMETFLQRIEGEGESFMLWALQQRLGPNGWTDLVGMWLSTAPHGEKGKRKDKLGGLMTTAGLMAQSYITQIRNLAEADDQAGFMADVMSEIGTEGMAALAPELSDEHYRWAREVFKMNRTEEA